MSLCFHEECLLVHPKLCAFFVALRLFRIRLYRTLIFCSVHAAVEQIIDPVRPRVVISDYVRCASVHACICESQSAVYTFTSSTGWPQKWYNFLYALTLSNINRFSKLFHCQNQKKICNNTITKDPTTPQMCRYTTLSLWNVKCLKSNNWKQDDFCNNTFLKEINNKEQRVYCLSYCLK